MFFFTQIYVNFSIFFIVLFSFLGRTYSPSPLPPFYRIYIIGTPNQNIFWKFSRTKRKSFIIVKIDNILPRRIESNGFCFFLTFSQKYFAIICTKNKLIVSKFGKLIFPDFFYSPYTCFCTNYEKAIDLFHLSESHVDYTPVL